MSNFNYSNLNGSKSFHFSPKKITKNDLIENTKVVKKKNYKKLWIKAFYAIKIVYFFQKSMNLNRRQLEMVNDCAYTQNKKKNIFRTQSLIEKFAFLQKKEVKIIFNL